MNFPIREDITVLPGEKKFDRKQHRIEYAEYQQKLKAYKHDLENGEWKLKPFNEFLDLIVQREDIELNRDHPYCPQCHSERLKSGGSSSTLVGTYGPFDCNHRWQNFTCLNCDFTFVEESKGHGEALPRGRYNVWYTKDNRVLRGIPTCFEGYIFNCRHCGGDVKRHYHNPGSREDETIITHVIGEGCKQEVWYRCDGCHAEVKCSNEYFQWESPHRPQRPHKPRHRLRLGWVIYEEVGMVVVNDYAISMVDLGGQQGQGDRTDEL